MLCIGTVPEGSCKKSQNTDRSGGIALSSVPVFSALLTREPVEVLTSWTRAPYSGAPSTSDNR